MRKTIITILTFVLCLSLTSALNIPEFETGTGQGFGAPTQYSPAASIPEEDLQDLYDENEDSISSWMQQDFGDLSEEEINDLIKATLLANLDTAKDELNEYEWPSALITFLGNERISIHFEGEYELGATLEEGEITRLSNAAQTNPTLTIYVEDEILSALREGNLDVAEAFSKDWIIIDGHGISGNLKAAAANTSIWIWSWFN